MLDYAGNAVKYFRVDSLGARFAARLRLLQLAGRRHSLAVDLLDHIAFMEARSRRGTILKGLCKMPNLAGRSPSDVARQMYDISSARAA